MSPATADVLVVEPTDRSGPSRSTGPTSAQCGRRIPPLGVGRGVAASRRRSRRQGRGAHRRRAGLLAGGDLDWITSFLDDPAARHESLREGAQIIDELLRFPLPIIAAVNGPAMGLGCSVAMLCDVVLMSDRAYLADPHVSVGLVAGDGGAAFWPLLAPLLRIREYLYTGDRIPADVPSSWASPHEWWPPTSCWPRRTGWPNASPAQPAAALQGTKRVLNMHLAGALGGAVQAGFAAEAVTMETEEHRERLAALRPEPQGPEST